MFSERILPIRRDKVTKYKLAEQVYEGYLFGFSMNTKGLKLYITPYLLLFIIKGNDRKQSGLRQHHGQVRHGRLYSNLWVYLYQRPSVWGPDETVYKRTIERDLDSSLRFSTKRKSIGLY